MTADDEPHSDPNSLRIANEQLVLTALRSQASCDILQARYAQLTSRIAEAVVETDGSMRITSFNAGAAALYGWSQADVLGRTLNEVTSGVKSAARAATPTSGQWTRIHHKMNGETFTATGTTVALYDDGGRIAGYLIVLQDLTAHDAATEITRELKIARQIQAALLPKRPPDVEGWRAEWRLQPQHSVGGDLVSFIEAGDRVRCAVADVTGRGISAALSVRTVHHVFHNTADLPLEGALQQLNCALTSVDQIDSGVSCVLLEFCSRSGVVRLCNAGHPPPLVWRAAGPGMEMCHHRNMVAGWYRDTIYAGQEVRLAVGDRLLVYTDGLSDAVLEDHSRLDEVGVMRLFSEAAHGPLDEVADQLLSVATCPSQIDDVTLLLIERAAA